VLIAAHRLIIEIADKVRDKGLELGLLECLDSGHWSGIWRLRVC